MRRLALPLAILALTFLALWLAKLLGAPGWSKGFVLVVGVAVMLASGVWACASMVQRVYADMDKEDNARRAFEERQLRRKRRRG